MTKEDLAIIITAAVIAFVGYQVCVEKGIHKDNQESAAIWGVFSDN